MITDINFQAYLQSFDKEITFGESRQLSNFRDKRMHEGHGNVDMGKCHAHAFKTEHVGHQKFSA